jgi:hypothetical protein
MPSPLKAFEPTRTINWGSREEEWISMARFQGYRISTYGNIIDWKGNPVEPYFNDSDVLCVRVSRYEWSFDGPLWMQMLRNFWGGNRLGVEFRYEDRDPTNLHIDNLTPMYRDNDGFLIPVKWRIDSRGNRVIDRRLGTKYVKIVESGDIFPTVRDAAEAIGGVPTQIYAVLRGRAKTHRGFTFELVDDISI